MSSSGMRYGMNVRYVRDDVVPLVLSDYLKRDSERVLFVCVRYLDFDAVVMIRILRV